MINIKNVAFVNLYLQKQAMEMLNILDLRRLIKEQYRSYVYPGYYWLTYDWSNLLYSCEKCNRSYKKNEFSLGDELTRKTFHAHPNNLVDEDRLLIDPTTEDPALFLVFKEEVPVPRAGSLKGAKTIEVLNLDRMNESRLNHLKALRILLTFTTIDPQNEAEVDQAAASLRVTKQFLIETINHSNSLFASAAKDSAKFACCVRSNFPGLPTV